MKALPTPVAADHNHKRFGNEFSLLGLAPSTTGHNGITRPRTNRSGP